MSNNVYANNREVSCKAGNGKSICAFPDVCMTPPENPATPPGIPVPYPNTGMDSDTTEGSRTVRINGKEAMLKNKSYFKRSMGDEAGCAAKKGVVSSVNRGKVFFVAWSIDVKLEGQNVVRNLDMTTHNHGSPTNTPPQIFAARMAIAKIPGCAKQAQQIEDACGKKGENFTCPDDKPLKDAKAARDLAPQKSRQRAMENIKVNREIDKLAQENKGDECRRRMRCALSPYQPNTCCPGQTPHHLVEAGAFHDEGRGGFIKKENMKTTIFIKSMFADTVISTVSAGPGKILSRPIFGAKGYKQEAAPCVCCEGESQNQGTHKLLHQAQDKSARAAQAVPNPNPFNPLLTQKGEPAKMQRLDSAISSGVKAVESVFKESKCDPTCVEAQLKDYHYEKAKMNPQLPIKAVNGQGKALPAS